MCVVIVIKKSLCFMLCFGLVVIFVVVFLIVEVDFNVINFGIEDVFEEVKSVFLVNKELMCFVLFIVED